MIKTASIFTAKSILIWIIIVIGSVIGAMILGMNGEGVGNDGPLTGEQAFLIVNAIHALIITIIAERAHVRGLRMAILIWATLFFAQSFFLLIEAIYFIKELGLSLGFLLQGMAHSFIIAIITAAFCALLYRNRAHDDEGRDGHHDKRPMAKNILTRIGLVAITYVISYFLAGYFIAWASPTVREYYDFGVDIALAPLLSFQLFRGALWALLALFIAQSLRGSIASRAIIIGAAFSILATAQLLYPSTFMPWDVRLPHMIEVGISNFIFGVMAGIILQSDFSARRSKQQ